MASSFYTNTLHVNFESVLAMDDPGMVSMFQALMASGIEGFLGCPAVIYEAALVELFTNASVHDGMVVSTVHGVTVEFSEQLFAETFELPLEGLSELSEIPKDLVFDARSIVSLSGEPVSMSGKKKEMKFEYRLLCDILAKTISVKAGSFDALTMEKFLMLTATICEVKINWNRVLFNILKDMVTAGSRQAKGYAIQISLLLENMNWKLLMHQRSPKKKAASKKRPAAVPVVEPVVKKKRTTKKKSGSSQENLEIMSDQLIETIVEEFDEPAVEVTAEEIRPPSTDDVDDIIEQVLAETAHIEADEEDHGVGTSDVGHQPAGTADDSRTALRVVQRIQSSVSALPSVQSSSVSVASQKLQLAFSSVVEDEDNQMDIDQRLASPTTTADSSMNFSDNDILLGDDATPNQPSLPTVSNLSTYLDVFRTLLWQRLDAQSEDIRHIGDSHNDVLSRLNTLDKGLRDALLQQGEDLRKLIQNVRQYGRTLDDVQTLRFNEFRRGFLAHSAVVTADSMDFRKEFRALNDKGEVSSSRPQSPPDDQNRDSGNTGGDNVRTTDIVDGFSGGMSREGRGRGRSGEKRSSGDEVFRRCNQPLRHKGRYFKLPAGAYFQELKLSAGAYFQELKLSAGAYFQTFK
ncbi:hypothetical protein F511_16951 [Dorcoceras hygrometricum]|uniref:Dystroglycan-like n=1 Tax=Dorcoceras hygrometricum TaxID=472368 RepID=A0A2Z7B5Q2_9LAMI|nr:hypothetical protein F511_16951 [Dorcoceras hygrometricum]